MCLGQHELVYLFYIYRHKRQLFLMRTRCRMCFFSFCNFIQIKMFSLQNKFCCGWTNSEQYNEEHGQIQVKEQLRQYWLHEVGGRRKSLRCLDLVALFSWKHGTPHDWNARTLSIRILQGEGNRAKTGETGRPWFVFNRLVIVRNGLDKCYLKNCDFFSQAQ